MRLLLVYMVVLFLGLVIGTEKEVMPKQNVICSEVVPHPAQAEVNVPDVMITSGWFRPYLFALNILDPAKQLDQSSDHDKSWYHLHGKMLRSAQRREAAVLEQSCCISEYWRLLSERHADGFYIYSLEKLLI